MDPNPTHFPILSYVMSRIPSLSLRRPESAPASEFDIEQPPHPSQPSSSTQFVDPVLEQMPHLKDPKVMATMTEAVAEIAQTRSVLQALGPRPDHEAVDIAQAKVVEIEAGLSKRLEEMVLSRRPVDVDQRDWRAHLAEKEREIRASAEKEKQLYKSIVQVDEMHRAYEKLLKDAEVKLMRIYDSAVVGGGGDSGDRVADEEVNEEVVGILKEGMGMERIDLSGRRLRIIPEAFGKIKGLVVLNLSNNQLEAIPDSIGGLETLSELDLSSNLLEALPDSIGLLLNLKILKVSGNKLAALPDTICHCKSLVEVDAGFNGLTYLPTNIGYELINLKRLSVHYNKICSLPTSIGDVKSLMHLDVRFNELRGLPNSICKLTNLETLNLSGNFSDLHELPDSLGELINLKELDLSHNQIRELPITFGRLENLVKLNLDQNPIEIPPPEVVKDGVEAVKTFMAKRWVELVMEEERKSVEEMKEETETGWLKRSLSRVSSVVSSVSQYLGSPRSPRDAYLDQQL